MQSIAAVRVVERPARVIISAGVCSPSCTSSLAMFNQLCHFDHRLDAALHVNVDAVNFIFLHYASSTMTTTMTTIWATSKLTWEHCSCVGRVYKRRKQAQKRPPTTLSQKRTFPRWIRSTHSHSAWYMLPLLSTSICLSVRMSIHLMSESDKRLTLGFCTLYCKVLTE